MKGSAITGRGNMVQTRHWVERAIAIALLIVSVLGTVVVLHGGWAPVRRGAFTAAGVLGGLLLQGVLTWAQWAYGDNKRSLVYLVALAVDAGLTAYGYGPLLVAPLASWLGAHAVPGELYAAWLLVIGFALALAWYPESRLID
jgi:hypothetical protein